AQEEINIQMISTSEIKISTLVARDQSMPALRAVHRAFELEKPEETVRPGKPRHEPAGATKTISFEPRNPAELLQQLQGMEELTINDVVLDTSQGRVTIFGVPDTPGVAQHVFQQIGQAGIFVDMIVQSYPIEGTANLSFTVAREDLTRS